MNKHRHPMELAEDLAGRSICQVRVGAVIVDKTGRVVSWGWNHSGPGGVGMCAERHAISRANRKRLDGSTIYIYGVRYRNGRHPRYAPKAIEPRPCQKCQRVIDSVGATAVWNSPRPARRTA